MPTRQSEIIPRRILAIQSGMAILAVVIGASERIDVVRWAIYLGHPRPKGAMPSSVALPSSSPASFSLWSPFSP